MKTKNSTNAEQKQLVHFEFDDTAARNVSIAGSFNDWRPDVSKMVNLGPGHWAKNLKLLPGTYEYRFVVDGKWLTDRRCARTVPNPFGDLNSLLTVAKPGQNAANGDECSAVNGGAPAFPYHY